MKIHLRSDDHVDIERNEYLDPQNVECDVVLHPGDVCQPLKKALERLRETFPTQRIIYVPGNHDFYSLHDDRRPELKTTIERELERGPEIAASLGIDLLLDSSVVIDGVRFLGGTLWTDFQLRPAGMPITAAMREALRLNDYRVIKTGRGRSHDVLKPADTLAAHRRTVAFLERELSTPHDGPTVVVTHHAPSAKSLFPDMTDLIFCYASDLEYLMIPADGSSMDQSMDVDGGSAIIPADFWFHGHVHRSVDYTIGATRVMANPRGYPLRAVPNPPRENPHFDETLIMEIGAPTLKMGM